MPTSDERVRVVVADDHPFFRDGVRRGLTEDGRIEVVAEAADGREAIEADPARAARRRPRRLPDARRRRRRRRAGHRA